LNGPIHTNYFATNSRQGRKAAEQDEFTIPMVRRWEQFSRLLRHKYLLCDRQWQYQALYRNNNINLDLNRKLQVNRKVSHSNPNLG
jgi:hypothetical protein